VYLSTGLINFWAASTIRHQGMLVGRLVSISQVGLPAPSAVWLGYLIPELLLPVVIAVAHAAANRHASRAVTAV
jgi:hypothetical protein